MAKKHKKTNAMRIVEEAGIAYEHHEYDYDEDHLSGRDAAKHSDLPAEQMFKTIVCQAKPRDYYVFVLPILEELNLKQRARIAGVKKLELLPLKDLLKVTGYVRGGCSPVGMKQALPTYIDQASLAYAMIYVSAGKRGFQLGLAPRDLADLVQAEFHDLSRSE
ncbi:MULTISPECIES: Cys-tRNA(Pro) deacylase [Aerococcus]|uniref:Cys-tRNA(Pro)/Cys-tRNA(Cys) deacylase n=1 Tax=Aerococcus sanguinicola TaxID=119206 RepID=A0A5N1GNQ2_9LACT|nr:MULTISPECIES: Cys-tRNA(Pro) deacylase [Aerococcus]KAA9301868.1 Cys-tRNA(Pro) deacylase [Aerococcus sanguinicola]MDK6368710.1 Cys-tRNA(Pro) deacylase [Aerococcus sp. UMB9870]MDK6679258.1 Cys-tRNA(Pro) deacylase [Aerococcus sp. UMB8608]MDK6685900.1 Cys-tRNA(Pro) deacylase [Aerococcus sp. UMB8623]MDK6939333.1 Cys-tRNA(Pro) deacylase [Aerococcus sp. UMB8487]